MTEKSAYGKYVDDFNSFFQRCVKEVSFISDHEIAKPYNRKILIPVAVEDFDALRAELASLMKGEETLPPKREISDVLVFSMCETSKTKAAHGGKEYQCGFVELRLTSVADYFMNPEFEALLEKAFDRVGKVADRVLAENQQWELLKQKRLIPADARKAYQNQMDKSTNGGPRYVG